jgi:Holliday junction DNA helicase RuvA
MISYLSGTVIAKAKQSVTLQTSGGVGYEVFLSPLQVLEQTVGQKADFYTYLKVSDSDLQLFGFATIEAKAFFTLLLTVSGVGPKTAQNILSLGSHAEIQSAIARGDVKYLTGVSGLGKKTAERLVVELKGKIGNQESGIKNQESSGMLTEVVDALVSMGYSREEARAAIETIDSTVTKTEDALRLALKAIKK